VGVIGDPVAHSISPIFQQAAFDALGLDVSYQRWPTSPSELPERIAALRNDRVLGANVTVPHKETVIALLDEIDLLAQRVGAVNTITKRHERLIGTNTDVDGFRAALREAGGFDAKGKRALVLGAGGAARAVVLALSKEGAISIAVANRHRLRAVSLVVDLRSDAGPELVVVDWSDAVAAPALRKADLLVHCTTLGLAGSAGSEASPVGASALHNRLFVCDIVANPLITPLLRQAQNAGAGWLGGLPMLIHQGAASFQRWSGCAAPVDVMLQAAMRAMASM